MGFFSGKRILLTGHTGFKGTWLALMLEYLGAQVYGYALPAKYGALFHDVSPRLTKEFLADIRSPEEIRLALEISQPEMILHFAAHSSLDGAFENPGSVFEINTMGTVNLLEASRKTPGVRGIVVVTSDKCYRNDESTTPYREEDPLGAQDPYSTSKACQELVTQCYHQCFFDGEKKETLPRVATARASNTIGGGDWNDKRLIPYLTDCFLRGECAKIRNPQAIRPWQYVLDVLSGYLMLLKGLYQNTVDESVFNFGPDSDGFQTVESLIETYAGFFPDAKYQLGDQTLAGRETTILKLDNSRAKDKLSWKPCYSFEATLAAIAEFAKRRYVGEIPKEICFDMIVRYLEKVGEKIE